VAQANSTDALPPLNHFHLTSGMALFRKERTVMMSSNRITIQVIRVKRREHISSYYIADFLQPFGFDLPSPSISVHSG
jgi:hypothetical protein